MDRIWYPRSRPKRSNVQIHVKLVNHTISDIVEAYCSGGRYYSVVRFLVLTKKDFLLIAKVLKETIEGYFFHFCLTAV